jgi:hypothetical protein
MAWRRGTLAMKFLATGIGMAAMLGLFILPIAGDVQQQPVKDAALLAKARGYDVVMWGLNTPSFIVYSGRLAPRRDPLPGEIALTKTKRLADLPDHEVLFRKRGIALIRLGRTKP